MFDLMLMRHAKSDWHTHTTDMDRPLNGRGINDAIKMGIHLNRLGLVPDCMIISGAHRTRETAKLLLDNLPVPDNHLIVDKELYLADRETLQEVIEVYAAENRRLLIMAHNPGMDDLVSHIASTQPVLSESRKLMVTCAVACFRIESLDALKKSGQCNLQSLYRPKEIASADE